MPIFVQYRAQDNFPPDAIPDEIADMPKIAAGIISVTGTMRLQGRQDTDRTLTGDQAYAHADVNLLFRTSDDFVCPAPKSMIVGAFDTLISGKFGDVSRSNFDSYFPDFSLLKSFSGAFSDFLAARFRLDTELNLNVNAAPIVFFGIINKHLQELQRAQDNLYTTLGLKPSDGPVMTVQGVLHDLSA